MAHQRTDGGHIRNNPSPQSKWKKSLYDRERFPLESLVAQENIREFFNQQIKSLSRVLIAINQEEHQPGVLLFLMVVAMSLAASHETPFYTATHGKEDSRQMPPNRSDGPEELCSRIYTAPHKRSSKARYIWYQNDTSLPKQIILRSKRIT